MRKLSWVVGACAFLLANVRPCVVVWGSAWRTASVSVLFYVSSCVCVCLVVCVFARLCYISVLACVCLPSRPHPLQVMKKGAGGRSKMSRIEKTVNLCIGLILATQAILCSVSTILEDAWTRENTNPDPFYLQLENQVRPPTRPPTRPPPRTRARRSLAATRNAFVSLP
jgi:hypothetical protein